MENNNTLFITNIGSRDIYFNDKPLSEFKKNEIKSTREKTKILLDSFEENKNNISIPILEKNIQKIITNGQNIDHIILIATDQEEEKFQHTDTLYSAEIAKKLLLNNDINNKPLNLKHIVKQLPSNKKKFEIKLIKYEPQDFDTMNSFYSNLLKKCKFYFGENTTVYISLVSGTQAMNNALIFSSIENFGINSKLLYASEYDKKAYLLNTPEIMVNNNYKKEIKSLINHYQYYAAKEIALKANFNNKDLIIALLSYSHNRLAYNFQAAENNIDDIIPKITGKDKITLKELQNEIIDTEDNWNLLELIYNAEIKLKNAQYADFLGRIFNFRENIGKLYLNKINIPINENDTIKESYLSQNPELETFLNKNFNFKFDKTRPLNWSSCLQIIEFYSDKFNNFIEIKNNMDTISKLAQLRNHSIIAHKFKGVSKEIIEDIYQKPIEDIPRKLFDIYCDAVSLQTKYNNPFNNINKFILDNLD